MWPFPLHHFYLLILNISQWGFGDLSLEEEAVGRKEKALTLTKETQQGRIESKLQEKP